MSVFEIIFTSVVISMFCVGLRIISSPGMIFYFLRSPYEKTSSKLFKFIFKPIIGCVTCMGSVHSIWIFIAMHGASWELIVCAISSAGLNAITFSHYERISSCA